MSKPEKLKWFSFYNSHGLPFTLCFSILYVNYILIVLLINNTNVVYSIKFNNKWSYMERLHRNMKENRKKLTVVITITQFLHIFICIFHLYALEAWNNLVLYRPMSEFILMHIILDAHSNSFFVGRHLNAHC